MQLRDPGFICCRLAHIHQAARRLSLGPRCNTRLKACSSTATRCITCTETLPNRCCHSDGAPRECSHARRYGARRYPNNSSFCNTLHQLQGPTVDSNNCNTSHPMASSHRHSVLHRLRHPCRRAIVCSHTPSFFTTSTQTHTHDLGSPPSNHTHVLGSGRRGV